MKIIDLDDERNCYIGSDGEYERWNINPDVIIEQPEIVRCKDCKYAHMTYNGECKYCDIWFPDEKTYMSGDYYCGSAERREG